SRSCYLQPVDSGNPSPAPRFPQTEPRRTTGILGVAPPAWWIVTPSTSQKFVGAKGPRTIFAPHASARLQGRVEFAAVQQKSILHVRDSARLRARSLNANWHHASGSTRRD